MPFNLFTSNKLEILADVLAQTISPPLPSVFDKEIIVIQSRGMQRWLSLQLAKKQGICTNIHFPFPNTFVHEIFAAVIPGISEVNKFEPQILTWQIMKILPGCLAKNSFEQLNSYLEEPAKDLKRLQLSARVADLFDQYLIFRTDMILDWERGNDNHWQAELWRELIKINGNKHRGFLKSELVSVLQNSEKGSLNLPARFNVFGISALPDYHMQLFDVLSSLCEVNIFLMNPCRKYWGDIRSEREITQQLNNSGQFEMAFDQDLHFTAGNALLLSMGKLGRDFFDIIEEKFDYVQKDNFVDPGNTTLLQAIQSDILNLEAVHEPLNVPVSFSGTKQSPGSSKEIAAQKTLAMTSSPTVSFSETVAPENKQPAAADASIQINSCHNRRREIEVLHDYLLDLFQNDPDLSPSDILVIAPDIEPYSPYIYAAFDLQPGDARRIPFNVADRTYTHENNAVEAFITFLDLSNSRFSAPEVLSLLEYPAIRAKFSIAEEDLALIQKWVKESQIRWGKDGDDRVQLGLPAIAQNSWQFGLERLLLGYALPSDGVSLFANRILPYDAVEGGLGSTLGNFIEFIERLFKHTDIIRQKYDLREWRSWLDAILDAFFAPEDEVLEQIQVIRNVVRDLEEYQNQTGFDEKIELQLIKYFLQNKLQTEGYGFGFLSGGITFCSMLPMRSIPAKVLCLIGMNNDTYPRTTRHPGFDLMAQHPRKGDRSRRNDDRYLFLEAILSAREKLYISFIGQNIKDNSVIPPSVVVAELTDYIKKNYMEGVESELVTAHKLQAFSPAYFEGKEAGYFSYSAENKKTAQNLIHKEKTPEAFCDLPLPEPDVTFREVTVSDLYRFFRNPARFFFNKCLGIFLTEDSETLESKERFSLSGLDRYDVSNNFLRQLLDNRQTEVIRQANLMSGELPMAAVGESICATLETKVRFFKDKLNEYLQKPGLPDLKVELELAGFKIKGKLEHLHEPGLILYRYAAVRAKDFLNAWIYHLVLNAYGETGSARNTMLAGVGSLTNGNWSGWIFKPVDDAIKILNQMLDIYWRGLSSPIRFFPESALVYAENLHDPKKDESGALNVAYGKWKSNEHDGERYQGESEDPYFYRCFRHEENPFDDEFKRLARQVYEPLLACRKVLD